MILIQRILKYQHPPEDFAEQESSFFKRLFARKDRNKILPECKLTFNISYTVPSWHSLYMEKIKLDFALQTDPIDSIKEGYFDEPPFTEEGPEHRILGNYFGIQNEYMELAFIDSRGPAEEFQIDSINKAIDWKLLFQLDSDDNLDLNIIDGGRIYFFIKEEELKAGNFSQARSIADTY